MMSVRVSWSMTTSASATARRAVAGLSLTSTIRGRPMRSTWVSRRRSARPAVALLRPGRRGSAASVAGPRRHARARAARPRGLPAFDVKPDDLHLGSCGKARDRLGDDREAVGRGERRQDVRALAAGRPCTIAPAVGVGRLESDAQEAPPARPGCVTASASSRPDARASVRVAMAGERPDRPAGRTARTSRSC